jgi:hypothetical protein
MDLHGVTAAEGRRGRGELSLKIGELAALAAGTIALIVGGLDFHIHHPTRPHVDVHEMPVDFVLAANEKFDRLDRL